MELLDLFGNLDATKTREKVTTLVNEANGRYSHYKIESLLKYISAAKIRRSEKEKMEMEQASAKASPFKNDKKSTEEGKLNDDTDENLHPQSEH